MIKFFNAHPTITGLLLILGAVTVLCTIALLTYLYKVSKSKDPNYNIFESDEFNGFI